MTWKKLPLGPLKIEKDSEPVLGGDLNTNGYNIILASDKLEATNSSGFIVEGLIDKSVARGDLVTIDPNSTSVTYIPVNITGATAIINGVTGSSPYTVPVSGISLESGPTTGSATGSVLLKGLYKTVDWPNITGASAGTLLYAGGWNGEITDQIPTSSGTVVQVVGFVVDPEDHILMFNPSNLTVKLS